MTFSYHVHTYVYTYQKFRVKFTFCKKNETTDPGCDLQYVFLSVQHTYISGVLVVSPAALDINAL